MYNVPIAYFISFRTYGTWLHGDERGSVDRRHNEFGTSLQPRSDNRAAWEKDELLHEPVKLSPEQRTVTDRSIREVCQHRGWQLHKLNVRTNHVHLVVTATGDPEPVMNAFKAWATRRLREAGLIGRDAKVWSRHGSTIYLFRPENFAEKCRYVRECQ